MVSTSQKICFHYSERRIRFENTFLLDEKKNCHWQECLKNRLKNGFHQPENPFLLSRMQGSFKNTFPLDGKIKLVVARVPENGRKYGFQQPENQFPLDRMRFFFKNWISRFTQAKKSLNKKIIFQLNRKLVSTSGNGEFI